MWRVLMWLFFAKKICKMENVYLTGAALVKCMKLGPLGEDCRDCLQQVCSWTVLLKLKVQNKLLLNIKRNKYRYCSLFQACVDVLVLLHFTVMFPFQTKIIIYLSNNLVGYQLAVVDFNYIAWHLCSRWPDLKIEKVTACLIYGFHIFS